MPVIFRKLFWAKPAVVGMGCTGKGTGTVVGTEKVEYQAKIFCLRLSFVNIWHLENGWTLSEMNKFFHVTGHSK